MIGTLSLTALAEPLQAHLVGADVEFDRLSTDTRSLQPNDAYLALKGAHFDGNLFVREAERAGASAAIVSRREPDSQLSQLLVPDTHAALGAIAALCRRRSSARVLALTGSQGKTTVKEMLGSILRLCGDTLITQANLNNTIGVPLTLLRLEARHDFAVIEMGANAAGEIDFSASVAQPDVCLITNASAAHIEGFGSLAGIVTAKGEILDHLQSAGVAVLNADDPHVAAWVERAGRHKIIRFSYDNSRGDADYFASGVSIGDRGQVTFKLCSPQGQTRISLPLPGVHNIRNALAASAAAMQVGAALDQVAAGLADVTPVKGRLQRQSGLAGSQLIDDSYNASPGSFEAAIDVLKTYPGQRLLIAGAMKELGRESASAHARVGRYAADARLNALWAVGSECEPMVRAFGGDARLFEDQQQLIAACRDAAAPDTVFLVKGSRGARMERVVEALRAEGET